MCTDVAENIATGSAQFNIEIDDEGPLITAAYNIGGTLNIITNEESQCAFDFNTCGFNFNEGELMSGSGFEHTTSFDQGLNYHVKCQDDLGNVGSCLTFVGGY